MSIRPCSKAPKYKMIKIIFIVLIFSVLGCDGGYSTPKVRTPEMESQAKNSVARYLEKKGLASDGLVSFKPQVRPEPGFSYLYTGSDRCIEIIVLCNGSNCSEVRAYPYERHGDKCPL